MRRVIGGRKKRKNEAKKKKGNPTLFCRVFLLLRGSVI